LFVAHIFVESESIYQDQNDQRPILHVSSNLISENASFCNNLQSAIIPEGRLFNYCESFIQEAKLSLG